MRLPNLLRTTAFRLMLMYVVLFAVSVLVLLGMIYWTTLRYIDAQIDQGIRLEMDSLRERYHDAGLEALRQTLLQRSAVGQDAGHVYLLAGSDYAPLVGNLPVWPTSLGSRLGWIYLVIPELEREKDEAPDIHEGRALAAALPGAYHLLVGRDLDEREDLSEHTLQVLSVAIGISLVLALFGGLWMSRSVLRRIDTINHTSRSIMAGRLERRMPLTGSGDEFDRLAANLNAMLDQIQRLMEGMRQVTDNVAHDLRSLLSRLRNRLEVTLLSPRDAEDYRMAIKQTLSDADELLSTFNALLSIAQAEAGANRADREQVDLSTLAHEVADLYQPLAEERGLHFTQQIAGGLRLQGNGRLLAQAIGNLLDNAIKYTPRGGGVQLCAGDLAGAIEIVVSDNGPGIPVELHDKVLERFARLETSRTTPGSGLGLSMVHAVARLHHATLDLADNHPGLKVILRLSGGSAPKPRIRLARNKLLEAIGR